MAKLIIKTGFRAITHDIAFQPQTTIKGKQLVLAQHVQDVKEVKCEEQMNHTIGARVIRQTSVTSTPYTTSLNIDSSRYVTSGKCDCVYNQSGRCKHIAALIYYINHEESFSKTSEEQQWGRPSARQFAKEKYSKGKYFDEMYPPAKKIRCDPLPLDVSELKGKSSLKLIMEAHALCFNKEENDECITEVVKNLVDQIEINFQIEDCIECFNNFCIFKKEFVVYKSDKIYEANIVMEDEKIIDLCCKTIEQSKCKEWYTARRLRISSSINVHHIKVRKTKSIDSLVQNMLFPKLIDCEATNYGKRNERHALEQYQKVYNCRVITVGVIVSKIQPWLCTSIDGVVILHGCITKMVEFKCPISCQKKAIVDFVSELCNVQYLEFVNGNIELKKKHSYYTQIQTQMYLTGMIICDLFVYSPVENGSCTVRVDRDEHFIKDAILKSEEFYFNHYLPRLYVSIGNEELNDKNNNKQILPKRSFTVNFKDEAEIKLDSDSLKEAKCVKPVKEVAVFNNEESSCLENVEFGMSEAAKLAGLYTAHEVKDDLVLGPEHPHRPDAALVVLSWALADKDGCPYLPAQECGSSETQLARRDCSVNTEHNQHHEVLTRNCIITDQENGNHVDQKTDTEEENARVKLMCDICGTCFICKSDLKKHIRINFHVDMEQERTGNGVTEHANRNLNRREHPLRECFVKLERLPNHEAMVAANERRTAAQHTTTYTDSDTDTELKLLNTKVYCEEKKKESICNICGMSFALKIDLKKHVMIHTHVPESSEQEELYFADSALEYKILKAGACQQKLALECAHSRKPALRDCSVWLERLHSDALLAGNQRPTPALHTTTHADTKSDTINEIYTKLDCEIPTCYLCGESFALKADLIKHVKSHIDMPTNKEQEDDVTEYASDENFSGASSCKQEPDVIIEHALGLDCRVRLERLPDGMLRCYMRPATSLRQSRASHSLAPTPSTDTPHKINLKKRDNHPKTKRYTCDICDRKFLHKNYLIKHIRLHLQKSRKPPSAKTSGKTLNRMNLTNKISLTKHNKKNMATNHSVSKTPTLSSTSSKDVHKGQKSYSCEICNGQFHKLNDFKIHKRLHLGLNVYSCSLCQKKFAHSEHYESHKRTHTGEKPYSCEICEKNFSQKGHMNYHKRVHTGEREFECEICKKHFMYRSTLNIHIRVCHTDIKPYSCEICKKDFKLLHHYKCHKLVHTDETPYNCEICDQKFKSKINLDNHIQLHTGKKPYFCGICDKRFALKKYYDSHKKVHFREKILKVYSCELCNEQFRHKRQYEAHRRRHAGKTVYTCDVCNKKFVILGYFEAHKRTHTGIRPYPCGQCEQTFAHIKALNCHKQSHTSETFSCDYCQRAFFNKLPLISHIKAHISEKTFLCEVCNKRFSSSFQHNRHKRVHMKNKTYTCKICRQQFEKLCNFMIHKRIHLGEFLYTCKLCDKKFIRKELFEAHERMHTGVKPFTCKICDKSFAQPSYLYIHTRVHTGEKPYKCDICHKQFAQCGDWNKHKRTHTGEKRHACEICNKRFAERRTLNLHKLLHTGEKPHSCEFCDLKFRHLCTLRIHRRLHTGEKPYSCENCNAQFAQSNSLKYHKERNCKGKGT